MKYVEPAMRLTDKKRAAIIDAAVCEFKKNGFQHTSMDCIAAAAQVSKRTVYNHFASKEDLFAEILNTLWQRAASQTEIQYDSQRSLRDQLEELLQQKMALLTDESFLGLARVVIAELIHSPDLARDIMAKINAKEQGITLWIRSAVQAGRLKDLDVEFASHQLQGLIKSFAFWPQVAMGQPSLSSLEQQKIIEATIEIFLSHYAKA